MMRCCKRNWGLWTLAAAVGGLYWLGRLRQAETRQASVQAIDDPVLSDSWAQASRLPPFRFLWGMVASQAVLGRHCARVLDVGCGAGQLATILAQRAEVREVTGIDLSEPLLEQARQRAALQGVEAQFLVANGAEMPFDDGTFDVVVSTLSLHHWDDPQRVLQEIHRVLVPEGKAVILDLRRDANAVLLGWVSLMGRYVLPAPVWAHGEPFSSFQAAYTPCEAILLAARAGWEHPRVSSGPFWLMLEEERAGV